MNTCKCQAEKGYPVACRQFADGQDGYCATCRDGRCRSAPPQPADNAHTDGAS